MTTTTAEPSPPFPERGTPEYEKMAKKCIETLERCQPDYSRIRRPMKWIKCSEKTPEDREEVLQYCPTDFTIIGGFRLEGGAPKGISLGYLRSNSTHWMSLPDEPKEE